MFKVSSFKKRGFTLAEILMVLGIIALLAGLILIGTKGIREKARITKLFQFSAQIHHALGAEAVGIWDFETGYGTKAKDSSGYGNEGTIYGAQWTTDTPSQTGYGLNFLGGSHYVYVESAPSLDFDDKITISVWVKFNNLSGNQTFVHGTIEGWPESYWFGKTDAGKIMLSLKLDDGTGPAHSYLQAEASLTSNVWYHLVGTYNGSNAKIYLDGKEIKEGLEKKGNIVEENGLRIGKAAGNDRVFDGLIDDLRIYKEGLSSSQIKKLYVEGLKKHLTINNEQ